MTEIQNKEEIDLSLRVQKLLHSVTYKTALRALDHAEGVIKRQRTEAAGNLMFHYIELQPLREPKRSSIYNWEVFSDNRIKPTQAQIDSMLRGGQVPTQDQLERMGLSINPSNGQLSWSISPS